MEFLVISRKYALFTIVVIYTILINTVLCQAPDTLWTKRYGTSYHDYLLSSARTLDSQFVSTGLKWTSSAYRVWLLKVGPVGDTIWTRTYGMNNTINLGYEVQPTSSGGYVITGYTIPYGSYDYDLLLIRTEGNGDTAWIRTFGGDTTDYGFSVDDTPDGGCIAVGYTESFGNGGGDLWLIKVDNLGNWQFSKTYGGSFDEIGNSVRTTADSGYIICGLNSSFSLTGMDGWLIKTDAQGDTVWTKSISHGFYDNLYAVRPLADGGYILTGWALIADTLSLDLSLIRTDPAGNVIWSKLYGGSNDDAGLSVEPTPDGGFIVGGMTYSFGSGGEDFWILKTDSLGDTLWTKTLGGVQTDECRSVITTPDNGYLVTGISNSFGSSYYDGWLVKLGRSGNITEMNKSRFAGSCRLRNNPVRYKTTFDLFLPEATAVSLKIFDAAGRLSAVPYTGFMTAGGHVVMGPDDLSAGVYFYRLETPAGGITGKLVVIR